MTSVASLLLGIKWGIFCVYVYTVTCEPCEVVSANSIARSNDKLYFQCNNLIFKNRVFSFGFA